ncbi:MAG TPA: AraC family transcriptional regulator [Gordonia sp. (in: high G+C Gram-positive bacteria)]|uniref:AraC family transcriptional regulator n=1 Tax=unclassified Gordonia (in: high G+C Gram-positive bacteria) TaxID=2657482 RepID=UPI0025C3B8A9|nr:MULTISPECIES: AraC family transcriptional regulator [unclassified Gordonia (in: high G+C Gram-positive bacteria)]HNP56595.1 AraC family transcriptional regulator [Gordonia sp. (in: high G+C Gram-positive bacteria)]HRC49684.1 AraC family transcriptional regulator [Gordonia sp. (in: high G+C Gram-positive bacteria)]
MIDRDCTDSTGAKVAVSTRDLAWAESREVWSNTVASTYCEMDLSWPETGKRGGFTAEVHARGLGDMSVSKVRADPHAVIRTPTMISSGPSEDLLLCLITEGTATISQSGRSDCLDEGAFGFVDASMPFVVRGETEFAQIVLRIPGGKLRDRVTTPVLDEILGRRISAQSGVGRLASRMLVDIVADVDELGDDECEHIAPAIAEMVAAAVAQCAPTPSLSQTDRIHARDLWMVQQALLAGIGDPERTVAQVGVELGMSVRYIHNLFTIVGTTPRKWLYDRRIDRACVLLRTTEYSCAEVCDELGFSDVSHFSRVFRRVTGTSPGRYRTGPR